MTSGKNHFDADKYIESQAKAASPVTVGDLVCKNCRYCTDDDFATCFCEIYKDWNNRKPNSVLLGKDCPSYRRKTN